MGVAERAARLLLGASLALTMPLLEMAAAYPNYFAAYQCDRLDLLLVAVVAWLALPLGLGVAEWIAGRVRPAWGQALHRLWVGLLVAALGARLGGTHLGVGAAGSLALGLALAAPASWLVGRRAWPTSVVLTLALGSAAPVLLFLLASPVAPLVLQAAPAPLPARVEARTPVVLVVFDDMPLAAVTTPAGELDPQVVPHLRALAGDGTWYRNASTVHSYTNVAIPALLTGMYPEGSFLPVASQHPRNLFRILGATYRLHAVESGTQLISSEVENYHRFRRDRSQRLAALAHDAGLVAPLILDPAQLDGQLASVAQGFRLFEGRQRFYDRKGQLFGQFQRWVEGIRADDPPTLYYMHSVLPHAPWQFLPSGGVYDWRPVTRLGLEDARAHGDLSLKVYRWGDDEWLVRQHFQRMVLQAGYADGLLGVLVRKLKETGLYDRALVVVCADHGSRFQAGEYLRRAFTPGMPEVVAGARPATYTDVLPIPLVVKPPSGPRGVVSDRPVESVDLLPTMLDLLGGEVPWPVDGVSAVDPGAPARATKRVYGSMDMVVHEYEAHPDLGPARDRLRGWFAEGPADVPWFYRLGPHAGWIGRTVPAEAEVAPGARAQLQPNLAGSARFGHLAGTLTDPALGEGPVALAVSLAGQVVAVTRTAVTQGAAASFIAFFPERVLGEGERDFRVWKILDGGARLVAVETAGP